MKKLHKILSRKVKEPQGGTSPNLSLHKGKKNSGFTLVELIIVITILAILATIAFVSFQNFSKDARDGNRLTTLKNIEKGLRLEYERNQKYPNPEGTTLVYVGNLIQGYAQDSISQKIGLNKPAKDPKNDNYYPYTVNGNQDKFQITGYLELENEIIFANNIFTQTYADTTTNYKDRYMVTFGDRLGYLYDPTTNAPLQEIDPDKEVGILFSNNPKDETNTIASGSSLGGKLALGQSACELDNQIILQGQTIQAYNTNTYSFGISKPTPIARTCNNQILSGDSSYIYITITEQQPQNCEATSYSGYTVPQLNHNQIQELTKSITLGNKTIEASCYNGVLSYSNNEVITCDIGKIYDDSNKSCNENMCTGTQPDNTTLVGTQKYNTNWTYGHDTNSFCNYEWALFRKSV